MAYGFIAYLMWGFFPLFFKLLENSGAVEIVAHRAIWSLVFCLLLIVILRQGKALLQVLRKRRAVLILALAGLLVAVNWSIYIYGITTHRTLDAALGYFINPLFSALLGVLVLREKLSRLQWVAFGFGMAAVIVMIVAYGQVPFVALGVATSFAIYGLAKKSVGAHVDPFAGLAIETAAITPIAVAYLIWLSAHQTTTIFFGTTTGWLAVLAGPITALPLLFFAAAARRVSLVTIGILQYIAPISQFLLGWLAFGEPMPPERWAGFILVWIAVILFAGDGLSRGRRFRRRAATGSDSPVYGPMA